MQTFETTQSIEARRCRYAQFGGRQAKVRSAKSPPPELFIPSWKMRRESPKNGSSRSLRNRKALGRQSIPCFDDSLRRRSWRHDVPKPASTAERAQ